MKKQPICSEGMLLPELTKAERNEVADRLEALGRTDLAAEYRPRKKSIQEELNATMKQKFDEKFPSLRQRPEGSTPVLMSATEAREVVKRLNVIERSDVTVKFRTASGYRANSHFSTQNEGAMLEALGYIVESLLIGDKQDAVVETLNRSFDKFCQEVTEKLVVQTVRRVKD